MEKGEGGIDQVNTEQVINAPQTKNVLDKQFVKTLRGEVNPSVRNIEKFTCKNTSPLTILKFKDGQNGQSITILGEGFTSIDNNATIRTNTGAAKLLLDSKVYRFTNFEGIWYEDE